MRYNVSDSAGGCISSTDWFGVAKARAEVIPNGWVYDTRIGRRAWPEEELDTRKTPILDMIIELAGLIENTTGHRVTSCGHGQRLTHALRKEVGATKDFSYRGIVFFERWADNGLDLI